jgi:hypothetical protein
MGLEMKPHSKLYPLGWVCDKEKNNVTKQCRVRFSIASKLIDEVDLDVVPLDICGIVLGSPYLYDRKAVLGTSDAFQGCDPSHKKELIDIVSNYDDIF